MADPTLAFTKYARKAMSQHGIAAARIESLFQFPDRVAAGADGALNVFGKIDDKDVRVSIDAYLDVPLVIRVSVLGQC